MKQVILNFPQQFAKGIEAAKHAKIEGVFDNLIVCGVGGSALPGSLLLDMADLPFPVFIHRNYGLPAIANEKSLIICISFSGNTEETLSAFQEALIKNLKPIAITTGGKLQELAQQNNLPAAIVPNDCLQPRFGTGYLVCALIKILENCGLAKGISQEILKTANSLKPENFETKGTDLAKKLTDKIPVVYASSQYKSVAKIRKIKINENSKIMAFRNYFPELNHNDMVG
ncbi:MAG: SIS domain-containing protein [Candidatus Pacebacteria bacterium]|nr:SIS domain-containing protein [Candidatus Paceibacterota bacterium]